MRWMWPTHTVTIYKFFCVLAFPTLTELAPNLNFYLFRIFNNLGILFILDFDLNFIFPKQKGKLI